jgi:hypothetical protein
VLEVILVIIVLGSNAYISASLVKQDYRLAMNPDETPKKHDGISHSPLNGVEPIIANWKERSMFDKPVPLQ